METEHRPARAWTIAVMLFVFIIVNFADKIVLGLVAVPMMEELKFTPSEFGLIGSSFFWLFAISGIAGGYLADHYKSKWLIFGMTLVWSITQVPIVFGASMFALIAARVMLGVAEGPAWPVAVHAVYKWFPDRKRNLPIALLSQGGAIGLLVAGLTIPIATKEYGWRASFVGLAAIGAIWAVLWLVIGEEGPIKADAKGQQAAVREQPLKRVLADPSVWGNILLHFVAYWSLAGVLTWLPAYFQKGLGYDGVAAGRVYGIVVATTIPLVLLSSWWSQRLLSRGWTSRASRGRFACLWLMLGGLLLMLLLLPQAGNSARIAIFAMALGLTPSIYALGPAMLAQVSPASKRGIVLAIDNSVASIAGILAPAVSGRLIETYAGAQGYEYGFVLGGALLIAGGIIGWFTVDPERSIVRLNNL